MKRAYQCRFVQCCFQVLPDLLILYIYIVESHCPCLGRNGSPPTPMPPLPTAKILKISSGSRCQWWGFIPRCSSLVALTLGAAIYIYLSWALSISKSIAVNTPCSIAKMFSTCKCKAVLRTLSSRAAKVAENQTPMGFVPFRKRTARCGSLPQKINPPLGIG